MKYITTDIKEHKGVRVGSIRQDEPEKPRTRLVMCKGIHKGEDGKIYAHWQYILRKTGRPSGKSTSFLTEIK